MEDSVVLEEKPRIQVDVNFAMAEAVGGEHGLAPADFERLAGRLTEAVGVVEQARADGAVGFLALPYQSAETLGEIERLAEEVRGKWGAFVNLGIGGSALGGSSAVGALAHPCRNLLASRRYRHRVSMFFPDNVDPFGLAALLDIVDPVKAFFAVVSKSGGTAETAAQFLIVLARLREELGDEEAVRDHFVFVTDPEQGVLRRLARAEGWRSLAIPPNVGGRFSVLSPVGLLPISVAGFDIGLLLAGAREMDERCRAVDPFANPALAIAAIHYIMDVEKHKNIAVMMPYADRLLRLADWHRQLWAESLGKARALDGRAISVGQTPVAALGATDQHSQSQLFMEGPRDKLITFLALDHYERDIVIPTLYGEEAEFGYLGGRSLAELIGAEREATALALARAGRPNLTVNLRRVDEYTLGQFYQLYQLATAYAGALYQVNPYDQPGVELSKQLTYGLLGRAGFEAKRDEARQGLPRSDKFVLG